MLIVLYCEISQYLRNKTTGAVYRSKVNNQFKVASASTLLDVGNKKIRGDEYTAKTAASNKQKNYRERKYFFQIVNPSVRPVDIYVASHLTSNNNTVMSHDSITEMPTKLLEIMDKRKIASNNIASNNWNASVDRVDDDDSSSSSSSISPYNKVINMKEEVINMKKIAFIPPTNAKQQQYSFSQKRKRKHLK